MPTSAAPTTAAPTTGAPTTGAPTTGAPTDGRPFVDSSPSNELVSTAPYVKRWGPSQAPSWGDT